MLSKAIRSHSLVAALSVAPNRKPLYNTSPAERLRHLGVCLLLACCWLACFSVSAKADGGAPNLAYVAGSGSGVSVINIAQRRVSKEFHLDGDPHSVLLSADGSALYVAQPAANRIAIVATSSGKIHCSAAVPGRPAFLALSPQQDVLYVAGSGDLHIRAYNPQTCALLQTFQASGPVSGLAISLVGGAFPKHNGLYQFWATTPDEVTAFDTDGTVLGHFPVHNPQNLCIPASGFVLYATTRQGTVVAIDLSSHKVTAPLLQGSAWGTMDYDATTGEIYVPSMTQHQVVVLSPFDPDHPTTSGKVIRRLPVAGTPVSIAITSDGQLGFVAEQGGYVSLFDIPGRRLITTFTVGGSPHFIITGLYPPVSATLQPQVSATSPVSVWRQPLFIALLVLCGLCGIALLSLLFLYIKRRP